MLDELHPENRDWLLGYGRDPGHALIVQLNHPLERQPLTHILKELLQANAVIEVNDDEAISIESVRSLQHLAKLRKQQNEPHVFVLNVSSGISIAAQNSLLKLLEEPPKNTIMVLFVTDISQLLPTILSRAQLLRILPLTVTTFTERLSAQGVELGRIPALGALYNHTFALDTIDDETLFTDVRAFLSASHGDRLKELQALKQRESATDFLERLVLLAAQTQSHTASKGKGAAAKTWLSITQASLDALAALRANGNVTLHLQRLAISIPTMR